MLFYGNIYQVATNILYSSLVLNSLSCRVDSGQGNNIQIYLLNLYYNLTTLSGLDGERLTKRW